MTKKFMFEKLIYQGFPVEWIYNYEEKLYVGFANSKKVHIQSEEADALAAQFNALFHKRRITNVVGV